MSQSCAYLVRPDFQIKYSDVNNADETNIILLPTLALTFLSNNTLAQEVTSM